MASLDAEKCFDTVCHFSLFVKLIDIFPVYKWMFLYKWYSNLNAVIKWNAQFSINFPVTRGTRQGSVLSPYLFNVFIDQLLQELSMVEHGVLIGNKMYNSLAYADDISIMCTSIVGLQKLLDVCCNYSSRWRFNFNKEKSKCMIIGKSSFIKEPKWSIGMVYNQSGACSDHVDSRIKKCRQSFYGLSSAGMLYPGASTDVQSHLFNHICQPTLTYGLDCINISQNEIVKLDSAQGKLIKQSLGLSKRSHNTQVLQAMGVKKINELASKQCLSLYHRIGSVQSPSRTLLLYFLSRYILYGEIVQGSLLSRVVSQGHSVLLNLFKSPRIGDTTLCKNDGHVESLRHLLHHENFVKPYSDEHLLAHMLTTAF
jgi:hypothetical protein